MHSRKLVSKKSLNKFIKLNSRIVLRLDTLYKNKYDSNYFSRQALLEFYYFIQRINCYNEELNTVCFSFSNHKIRSYSVFKLKNDKGKREYELDRIIKSLIEDGIICVYRDYKNFKDIKSCITYSFTEDFYKFKIESSKINKYEELFVGNSELIAEVEDLARVDKDTKHQLKVMMDKDYSIDINEAINIINNLKDKNGKEYDANVKYYMEELVYNFNNKVNLYSKRGNLVDRIFTTFCVFKKDIRSIIRYKGEYLSSVDLRSTMPYLMFHEYKNENEEFKALYNLIISEDKDIYNNILEWQQTQPTFIEKPSFKEIKSNELTRDLIKAHFMRYLYSETMNCSSIVKNYTKDNFPKVHQFLTEKKKELVKSNKTLTTHLTSKEVEIFIYTGNSFENVLTLHDGLYFPSNIKDDVINKLINRFNELGYSNYKLHID